MGMDQIMYCIVALILGMLVFHMLKNVCGCKVEGQSNTNINTTTKPTCQAIPQDLSRKPNSTCEGINPFTLNASCSYFYEYDESLRKFTKCMEPIGYPINKGSTCQAHAENELMACNYTIGDCDPADDKPCSHGSKCQLGKHGSTVCVPTTNDIIEPGIDVSHLGVVNCSYSGYDTFCKCKEGYSGDRCAKTQM